MTRCNQNIRTYVLFFILVICSPNSMASQKHNDEDTYNSPALRTTFEFSLKFMAEKGVLNLSFSNDPSEEDNYYLKPYNLGKMTSFWASQHKILMNQLYQAFEINPTDIDTKNSILPIDFQEVGFNLGQKFSFPESILTLCWDFTSYDQPDDHADLKSFANVEQFSLYIQNCFAEELQKMEHEMDRKRFKTVQSSMYL